MKHKDSKNKTRINEQIRASELRVIGADGANLGVISRDEALQRARDAQLDLIEVSPGAKPPVAKILDYGKWQYEQKKKQREVKQKAHTVETKTVQVKIGTGEHDRMLKAKRTAQWLEEGNRVKVELFLKGRYKYMEFSFLKTRLEEFLQRIPAPYKVSDEIKKSPKGLTTVIEPDPQGNKPPQKEAASERASESGAGKEDAKEETSK